MSLAESVGYWLGFITIVSLLGLLFSFALFGIAVFITRGGPV